MRKSLVAREYPTAPRARVVRHSENATTGPMLTTSIQFWSCPPSCPFMSPAARERGDGKPPGKGEGGPCYGQSGPIAVGWYQLESSKPGQHTWALMLQAIERLAKGEAWRYGQVGDVPHVDGKIDLDLLQSIIDANEVSGARGFGYTHHVLNPHNMEAIRHANRSGFTLNASCESPEEAAMVLRSGIPSVTVLPSDETRRSYYTSDGKTRVIMCPNKLKIPVAGKGTPPIQCITCGGGRGPLCSRPDRDYIIGFPAHGSRVKHVDRILQAKGGA